MGRETCARGNQGIQRVQAFFGVLAQAARVVKVNVRNLWALLANLQQLVHLLLVFDDAKSHIGVVERKNALRTHRILVQRDRNSAQRLRGQHGGVQAGAIGANDHHVLVALQPRLVQARCHMLYQACQARPAVALPNAVFFFAQRCGRGALSGMLEQQLRERRVHSSS